MVQRGNYADTSVVVGYGIESAAVAVVAVVVAVVAAVAVVVVAVVAVVVVVVIAVVVAAAAAVIVVVSGQLLSAASFVWFRLFDFGQSSNSAATFEGPPQTLLKVEEMQ